ncbi:MAG: hypothetical protein ACREOI_16360 [bacterium]
MATEVLSLPAEGKSTMSPRRLGTLGMAGSPMLFLSGWLYGFGTMVSNRVTALLGLIFVFGWICSALGIRLLRVTGQGAGGKVLFIIQLTGLLLAASQQVQELIFTHPEANGWVFFVADMAWSLSMLLMLIVGGFILRAGVWRGWRRRPALLCGSALPVSLAVSAITGRETGDFFFRGDHVNRVHVARVCGPHRPKSRTGLIIKRLEFLLCNTSTSAKPA